MSRLEGDARSDLFQEAAYGRVTLWEEHCRLLKRSKYLKDQLSFAGQQLDVKQSQIRAAYFRACEDRNNRHCPECGLWREVDLVPCFRLVCQGCSQRHMHCTSPYICTGAVREQPFSTRTGSLLDAISHEVRTLQEVSWLTNSIWDTESLVQDTHRLKKECEWLEQQLANTWWQYEKIVSVLNSAHSKATEDRRNRLCEGCLAMFGEVYLAPCFHLVCQACYPEPREQLCKACRHGPSPYGVGSHTLSPLAM